MPLPFHYSSLNYDLAQSTPSGSINIMWNQLGEKMKADSIMYMTPNFDPSIGYTYPEFGMWGNNLLNPMLAIQQTMQAFQNGTWMQGNSTNWFNPWGGNNGGNWWNNWNPWGNNNGGNSSSDPKYDALKAVLNKYIELNPNDSRIQEIRDAINKSGKPEEKMDALKNVYKKLNKTKLQKALLDLPEYKKLLDIAGYNFNGMNKDEDKKLRADLEKLSTNIKNKSCEYGGLVNPTADNILRTISYWNDSHKDDNSRGILKLIATNLKSDESEITKHRELVEKLTQALLERAAEFKAEYEGSFPKLDAAKDAVADALAKITDNKSCTQSNVEALAKEFDKLYAMLRIMEAEKISNTIQTKYNFLNDIASNDVDFVNNDLVVKATKEDLKSEGITNVETDTIPKEEVDEIPIEDKHPDKTPEELLTTVLYKEDGSGNVKKTAKDGVYQTNTTSTNEPPHLYMIKDDKLVELKDIKAIDKDGNCTMIDGTTKKKLGEVETVEVSGQNVIDYQQEIQRVDDLVKAGTLLKVGTPVKGVQVYKSKGYKHGCYRDYFIVRNGVLVKIDCKYVDNKTLKVVKNDNNKVNLSDLQDGDFTTISNSDIPTIEDEKTTPAPPATPAGSGNTGSVNSSNVPSIDTNSTAYKNAQTNIYDNLTAWFGTSEDDFNSAYNEVSNMNANNVRDYIAGYEAKRNSTCSWGDCILEQIAEERTDWLGGKKTGRKDMIVHIIKAVLDYCEKYPEVKQKEAYEKLKTAYNDGQGITTDMINNKSEDETSGIRYLDHLILDLLEVNI